MSFTMFVTWVLVGVVAGVLAGVTLKRGGYGLKKDITLGLVGSIGAAWLFRAVGLFPEAGIFTMIVVACIGAAIPIVAQRTRWPSEGTGAEKGEMWWRGGLGAAVVAVVAWMTLAPAQPPAAIAAVSEDRAYTVTPGAVKVKAGIVEGEVMNLKVTERIEPASGRIVTAAKLTGSVVLKNSSTNQSVRLVTGKLRYLDGAGKPIGLEDNRSEPILKFDRDQLDPAQEVTQSLDVEFPAEALKAGSLKQIRLDLTYVPAPYREETANFAVAIEPAK